MRKFNKPSFTITLLLFALLGAGCSQKKTLVAEVGASSYLKTIDFLDPQTGFLVSSTGDKRVVAIFRTTDGGQSWEEVGNGEKFGSRNFGNLNFIGFSSPQNGLVCGRDGALITKDGGQTWTDTFIDRVRAYDAIDGVGCLISKRYSEIAVHSADEEPGEGLKTQRLANGPKQQRKVFASNVTILDPQQIVAWGKTGLYYTTDGGKKWLGVPIAGVSSYKTPTKILSAVAAIPGADGPEFWVALEHTDGLLHCKPGANGYQYEKLGSSLPGEIRGLHFFDQSQGLLWTQEMKLYQTSDGGQSWKLRSDLDFPAGRPFILDQSHGWWFSKESKNNEHRIYSLPFLPWKNGI